MTDNGKQKLSITIRNKTKVLLQKECASISMINEIGPFDILPEHANFVAVVRGEILVRDMSGGVTKLNCVRGVTRVNTDVVDVVFLEE